LSPLPPVDELYLALGTTFRVAGSQADTIYGSFTIALINRSAERFTMPFAARSLQIRSRLWSFSEEDRRR
jgi:hypothetical protein